MKALAISQKSKWLYSHTNIIVINILIIINKTITAVSIFHYVPGTTLSFICSLT